MIETAHWSFICGNGTIFDQQILVCNYPQDSLPCDQAEAFYNLVEFGKIDDNYWFDPLNQPKAYCYWWKLPNDELNYAPSIFFIKLGIYFVLVED